MYMIERPKLNQEDKADTVSHQLPIQQATSLIGVQSSHCYHHLQVEQ